MALRLLYCVFVVALVAGATTAASSKIKHIIVLMEENQSYDHMLGWYNRSKYALTGKEFNRLNASDPTSPKVFVSKDAPYINYCDPDHTYPSTQYKIWGPERAAEQNYTGTPKMDGFVEWEHHVMHHSSPSLHSCGVMKMFDAEKQLPVMTALAEEFVLFDKFFCSIPGPTWPNRLFFLSGTSKGLTETEPWYHEKIGELFPQPTIFDQVEEAGGTWKYYYDDSPWEMFLEKLAHAPEHTHQMDTLYKDAREGTLPNFAFINPRNGINVSSGLGSNDMHPDHDVALGEQLYKDVYEALRASPQWNETLFIVTFDEHGGFYDHITPPSKVPSPGDFDYSYPDKGFDFNRGGMRIPTLMASPWLPKGKIESEPKHREAHYELTSIMATVRKLLPFMNNTKPLTERDAWAPTFEHLFDELSEPRTDCPMKLPDAPRPTPPSDFKEADLPPNSLQTHIMTVLSGLTQSPYPEHIKRQGDVAEWTQREHHRHREATFQWKQSRAGAAAARHYHVKDIASAQKHGVVSANWAISGGRNGTADYSGTNWSTISVTIKSDTDGSTKHWCMDYYSDDSTTATSATSPPPKTNDIVGVSHCYPGTGSRNRDQRQHWRLMPDHSVRPKLDLTLCVTNHFFAGEATVRLAPCDGNRNQHYVYFFEKAPGMGGSGNQLFFGAWMMTNLAVVGH